MTTTLKLPTPLKNITVTNRGFTTHYILVHHEQNSKGTAIATDGTTMAILCNLDSHGDNATKLVHRDCLATNKNGSTLELTDTMPISRAGNTNKVGEYTDAERGLPYADAMVMPRHEDISHVVTFDASKLHNLAMALGGKNERVTLVFPKNSNRPIVVNGMHGVGLLMPCSSDNATEDTIRTRFNTHKEATVNAQNAYEATRLANTLA
jgi:hypothetical protein